MTLPLETFADGLFVTVPTAQLAFFSAFLAAASVLPFSAGTLHATFVEPLPLPAFLPLLTVSATFAPAFFLAPLPGLLEMTLPLATFAEVALS